jgi:mannose-1-phosphate guanylyltransferase
MKAAVLAAGLGTRLRPLTYRLPKVLVPVLNRPLLGLILAQLRAAGFTQVAVNTHHLAELVHQFLKNEGPGGLDWHLSHEPELLGTGGGLRKLGQILGPGPFLALNGDILTDLDLVAVYHSHQEGAISTLVLHDWPPYNNVWTSGGRVLSIVSPPSPEAGPPLAYASIQVVDPALGKYIPPEGSYDLVTAWRQAMAAGERLAAVVLEGHFWQDLGTPSGYLAAHRRLLNGEAPSLAQFWPGLSDPLIGPDTVMGAGVEFGGGVCLGARVAVGAGVYLKNTVVWDGARIAPQVRLEDCIIASGVKVSHSAQGQMLV